MAVSRIGYISPFLTKCVKYITNRPKCFVSSSRAISTLNLKIDKKYFFAPIRAILSTKHTFNNVSLGVSCSSKTATRKPLNLDSLVDYENVSEETLESLCDKFEDLLQYSSYEDWDVNYSNGVLTVTLEPNHVYVINKQTPNRQIWLSSPVSGPKRYDYINGTWIYKHNGISLHQLLKNEFTELLQRDANFLDCSYSN